MTLFSGFSVCFTSLYEMHRHIFFELVYVNDQFMDGLIFELENISFDNHSAILNNDNKEICESILHGTFVIIIYTLLKKQLQKAIEFC
jgi:hypothetical protein